MSRSPVVETSYKCIGKANNAGVVVFAGKVQMPSFAITAMHVTQ